VLRENNFAEIDADGDGAVTQDEFTAAMADRAASRAAATFNRLDADGDGILSRDADSRAPERRQAWLRSQPQLIANRPDCPKGSPALVEG